MDKLGVLISERIFQLDAAGYCRSRAAAVAFVKTAAYAYIDRQLEKLDLRASDI